VAEAAASPERGSSLEAGQAAFAESLAPLRHLSTRACPPPTRSEGRPTPSAASRMMRARRARRAPERVVCAVTRRVRLNSFFIGQRDRGAVHMILRLHACHFRGEPLGRQPRYSSPRTGPRTPVRSSGPETRPIEPSPCPSGDTVHRSVGQGAVVFGIRLPPTWNASRCRISATSAAVFGAKIGGWHPSVPGGSGLRSAEGEAAVSNG
jgi:hypothetical protein